MENSDIKTWIDAVKARGWADTVRISLNVLEPLGILGAQILYIAQPAAGLFSAGQLVGTFAQILEEPGGIETLRRYLDHDEQDGEGAA